MSKLAYYFISLHFLSVYFISGSHFFGYMYFSLQAITIVVLKLISSTDIFATIFINLSSFYTIASKQHNITNTESRQLWSRRSITEAVRLIEGKHGVRCTGMEVLVGELEHTLAWCRQIMAVYDEYGLLAYKIMSISSMSSINVDIIKQRNNINLICALQILQQPYLWQINTIPMLYNTYQHRHS